MKLKSYHLIFIKYFVIFYFLLIDVVACAHDYSDARIDQLTERILENPSKTQFLLERGVLFTKQKNWQKAHADFQAVRSLARAGSVVDLHEANLWFSANRLALSALYVNRYLTFNPKVVSALQLRAEINNRLGRSDAAINDFSKIIKISNTVLPDMYLNLARTQAKLKPLNQKLVHQTILSGLDKLGSLVVLLEFVIDFDRQHHDYQSALNWFEQLPQRLTEQPYWIIEKANLLVELGRAGDAKRHYKKAYDGLQSKRRSGRFNKADQILLKKVESRVKQSGDESSFPNHADISNF